MSSIGDAASAAGMRWVPGGLAVSREAADRVARPRLSPSTAKSLHSCPARWAGEKLLAGEEDPFGAAPIGTAAHRVLELLYQLAPAKRTRAAVGRLLTKTWAEMSKPDPQHSWPGIDADRRGEWRNAVLAALDGLWTVETPAEVRVFRTEMQVDTVDVAGVPFRGTADRVVLVDGGAFGIDDFKTGRVPELRPDRSDDHGDQLRLYRAAVSAHLGGADITRARVIYTRHGVVRDVDLSPAAMEQTLASFADAWKVHGDYVAAAVFPTTQSALCGWCPLVASCPAARAAGRFARVDGLPSETDLGIPSAPATVGDIPAAAAQGADSTRAALSPAGSGGDRRGERGVVMATAKLSEGKPWEQSLDGRVNANSYSAMGAFGIVTGALRELHHGGVDITPRTVRALSRTFLRIVEDAQRQLSDSQSMQDGLHTRLRGALFAVLRLRPVPFGRPAGEWETWVSTVTRMVVSTTNAAVDLIENGVEDDSDPWADLVSARVTPRRTPDADPDETDHDADEHAPQAA